MSFVIILAFSLMAHAKEAIAFHGMTEMPVTSDIAVHSSELPMRHHDPCDRIIIATAQLKGLEIITSDKLISQYEVKVIW